MSDLAEELHLDKDRVLVAGASTGSGLAAGMALLARDRGIANIAGLLLECRMLDDHDNTPSAVSLEGLDHWDRADNELGWGALLGGTRGTPDAQVSKEARQTRLNWLHRILG